MMKNILLQILIMTGVISSCNNPNKDKGLNQEVDLSKNAWTVDKAKIHFDNQNDSLKWNYKMFLEDLNYVDEKTILPMKSGVYPVANYDIFGKASFKGLGSSGTNKSLKNKNVIYTSFNDKGSGVFFNVVILTDTLDLKNYNLNLSEISSRNHPNYIGQGTVKTKSSKIDFIAFKTIDENSYAIINMRLFDLKLGKTILIAPQVDKSLRSLQLEMPTIKSEKVDEYIDSLLTKKKVINFFMKNGTI